MPSLRLRLCLLSRGARRWTTPKMRAPPHVMAASAKTMPSRGARAPRGPPLPCVFVGTARLRPSLALGRPVGPPRRPPTSSTCCRSTLGMALHRRHLTFALPASRRSSGSPRPARARSTRRIACVATAAAHGAQPAGATPFGKAGAGCAWPAPYALRRWGRWFCGGSLGRRLCRRPIRGGQMTKAVVRPPRGVAPRGFALRALGASRRVLLRRREAFGSGRWPFLRRGPSVGSTRGAIAWPISR